MSNDFDDDGFGIHRVPDRPERPRPRPIDVGPTPKWVPAPQAAPRTRQVSIRTQVDKVVRLLLPILGLGILASIGFWLASLISGIFS